MENTYYLLRHGENVYQIKKKEFIYPPKDSSLVRLTKRGKDQVKRSLSKIKKEKINIIYSSNFYRTKETAIISSKELGIKEINFDKRLIDINMGIFHGEKKKSFYKFIGYKKRKFSKKPPKGESWNDLKKRMKDFLKEIDRKHKEKKILIVSHGDPLWILEGLIKGMTNQEFLYGMFIKKNMIKTGELRKIK
ncbi:MAG: histidine phosphatase family protein [bacterium]